MSAIGLFAAPRAIIWSRSWFSFRMRLASVSHPTFSPSDQALVASVLAGDRESFAPLVARYEGPLLRVAESRLGRGDLAEDAVQEAFLCAYRSLHSFNPAFSFRTWLWTILLNQCRRQMSRRQRRPAVLSWSDQPGEGRSEREAGQLADRETAPPEQLLERERSEQLDRLLAELPEVQADALRLRFFGGLKFHEIAETMGCSLSSAKNRVRVGLTRMSESIRAAGNPLDWAATADRGKQREFPPPHSEKRDA